MWGFYFDQLMASLPLFYKGLGMTVAVSALSLVGGTIIGVMAGIFRANSGSFMSRLLSIYVDFMRGTPFLVQVFIIFFILPEVGLHLEAFEAAVFSLTLYSGAYICEIVSAAIQAVPPGQAEACRSLGHTWRQTMWLVILPQALRMALPSLVGQYVLLIKDSSIVSVIGVTDITRAGWLTVQRIPEGVMVFGLVGLMYFLVCFPLIQISNRLEKRYSTGELKL
ncbi:Amino acid ABC transporter membrane protein 2, PAAT family (TC 3.A.1.3.-) [Pseudodesulfovibrio profundus]|uniref:Amino acid ABC transporter membrane protein 2, PAAT family (TC 3.A.1.3.-) n=1 Tax=Pseudodesulfovibrio profundus TaxID=57320 RepID=A0A2C8FCH7_9BACT|nr:amino acid ABC transporter permease [Pseudodesulfovibrio profundus]MBC16810.1 amino acid ABC transporter permease [Desulfovibrio sp.]SOB60236.1 Amino acid ABC transporter membrane protein 2, PAAT family (TC 3.A.1.3.-) [Pseudodesulfovibrio profundus]|tara:strand:- start:1480 stop:2148 length:669 start_codon:yes stop_codon:yes gene_type:complete